MRSGVVSALDASAVRRMARDVIAAVVARAGAIEFLVTWPVCGGGPGERQGQEGGGTEGKNELAHEFPLSR
jgi:hypothetical protein